jgi:branched-chain amino acid transport system substrate-binding protein
MTQNKSTPNNGRGISTMIAVAAIIAMLVAGLGIGYYALAPLKTTTTTVAKLTGVLKIGAALPLTGDLATYGQNAQTALVLAKKQINALLNSTNAGYTLDIIVEDTQTKPDVALTVTQDLASKGCQAILGYYSSGELKNSMSYAQTNQIVLVSPSSTAISLAINKPFVYRFCPADDKQGPAMAKAIHDLNVTYLVPIWRGDTYGDGLEQSTTARFAQLGGSYDSSGIRYDISASEYSSQVGVLAQKIQAAVNQYGASKVAVYAVTFEEITSIMTSATQYPVLSQVKWFGCDGSALSSKVTDDATTANFAITTMFPSTYFAPPNSSILTQVSNYVQSQVGHIPDPYAYGTYDSLWVVAKCIGLTQQYNGASINKVFAAVSNVTYGASGWTALNKFGDRVIGDYQFWQVYKINATAYSWYNSALYSAATDSVKWYPAP